MNVQRTLNQEERLKIAEALVKLSDDVLSMNQRPKDYITLDIGSRPNKNTITIRRTIDRISVYVRSTSLLDELANAGFKPEAVPIGRPRDKDRYRVYGVGIDALNQHESLFRRVVAESIEVIQSRRPRGIRK